MHRYASSVTAMFVCICSMCVCVHTRACVRVPVCVFACLSGLPWCVYLFMSSVGVFVCTVPLLRLKIRRHLLGGSVAGCQKAGEKSTEGEKGEKNIPAAPRYIYSDSPHPSSCR